MITITETAAGKLKGILDEEGQPEAALRVIVVPSGQGAQYMLALEDAPKSDDLVLSENGVRVVVDTDSLPLLDGAEIDYAEAEALTTYGIIGIKVWIYKGEVFAKEFSQETNKVKLKEDK